eukprot:Pgem_evm1s2344
MEKFCESPSSKSKEEAFLDEIMINLKNKRVKGNSENNNNNNNNPKHDNNDNDKDTDKDKNKDKDNDNDTDSENDNDDQEQVRRQRQQFQSQSQSQSQSQEPNLDDITPIDILWFDVRLFIYRIFRQGKAAGTFFDAKNDIRSAKNNTTK